MSSPAPDPCPVPDDSDPPEHCVHWAWEGKPCCWCGRDEDSEEQCPAQE